MKKIFSQKGFTLVEMLVAVGIFALVIAVAGGVFVGFVSKQRVQLRQYALQQDIYNFFDILDREIKTGYGDTFESDPNSELSFFNQGQNRVDTSEIPNIRSEYRLNQGAIEYRFGSDWEKITSNNTEIKKLNFIISDGTLTATSDGSLVGSPMRVTVSLEACPKDGAPEECINAQTTVTCRQTSSHPSSISTP